MIIGEKVGMRTRVVNKKAKRPPMETCRKCRRNLFCRCDFENRRRRCAIDAIIAVERGECPSFPLKNAPKTRYGTDADGRADAVRTSEGRFALQADINGRWMAEYKTKGKGNSVFPRSQKEMPARMSPAFKVRS